MNRYIENNNSGIIALIKRNDNYEYNAIDSSYCVLSDYEKEIRNETYFDWIKETKLDYSQMLEDFNLLLNNGNRKEIRKYLIWEKPNMLIDFDAKYLLNHKHDRAFEKTIPKSWKGDYVNEFWKLKKQIPNKFRYWINCVTLAEYLDRFSNEHQIKEELELIEKALSFTELNSYNERWDKFERELLGNVYEDEDHGWLSKVNYVPNLLMNRENRKIFLAYINDLKFLPNCELELNQIRKLLKEKVANIKEEKTDNT